VIITFLVFDTQWISAEEWGARQQS
jgi:hypothetical protein